MSAQVPELVRSFVDGDEADFAALVRTFRRKIYLTAHKIVGNHLDADEVVQETFVRIYRKRKELGNVKYISTFLMRVATNYAIDILRRRKIYRSLDAANGQLPQPSQIELARKVST
ncbi:MAG: RNA polymerase sigma factor, partial [Candidatus Zixiibacteriota bacterium]